MATSGLQDVELGCPFKLKSGGGAPCVRDNTQVLTGDESNTDGRSWKKNGQ